MSMRASWTPPEQASSKPYFMLADDMLRLAAMLSDEFGGRVMVDSYLLWCAVPCHDAQLERWIR